MQNRYSDYKLAINEWGLDEISDAKSVLDSGMCTQGSVVERYEQKFCEVVGVHTAVSVNSGSSANLLMSQLLSLEVARKVIVVPAIGWATSYAPFFQMGWEVVFCDVDAKNGCCCSDSLEEALAKCRPSVAMFISVLGGLSGVQDFVRLCEQYGVIPVGDFCEALLDLKPFAPLPTSLRYVSFSSYFSHHISTVEGGCLAVNSDYWAAKARSVRSHGWDYAKRNSGGNPVERLYNKFKFVDHGFNIRFNDVFASIGLVQLDRLLASNIQRVENFSRIAEVLHDKNIRTLDNTYGEAPFSVCILTDSTGEFERLVGLFERRGIEARPLIAGNFLRQPVMEGFNNPLDIRVADQLHKSAVVIGLYGISMDSQIELLRDSLAEL